MKKFPSYYSNFSLQIQKIPIPIAIRHRKQVSKKKNRSYHPQVRDALLLPSTLSLPSLSNSAATLSSDVTKITFLKKCLSLWDRPAKNVQSMHQHEVHTKLCLNHLTENVVSCIHSVALQKRIACRHGIFPSQEHIFPTSLSSQRISVSLQSRKMHLA